MKVQVIGLGNVGRSLIQLVAKEDEHLKSLGFNLQFVSISDSGGSAVDERGLDLNEVLKCKKEGWAGFKKYEKGSTALDAIKGIESDVVVELTASTPTGEPGLSHIKAALSSRKNVVTANKGPLVVAFNELVQKAKDNDVKLLYEATVAVHVPVFCLLSSCFIADEVLKVEGILNATTNFIIGEIESGKSFNGALDAAIKAGWAEVNYSDDVDGVDAARKVVILANFLYNKNFNLEDVNVEGIRKIEPMIREATKSNKKAKLVCEIRKNNDKIQMSVSPKIISMDDPLATVNHGNMGVKFTFKTCQEVFVSAQFTSTMQTAYSILNDILKVEKSNCNCQ